MKFGLFPKEIDFFEIFDMAASNLTKAASLFFNLVHLEKFDNIEVKTKEIYECEQEGDILTHEIIKKLNKTFVTPIDREDLYTLASRLDDILDLIWAATERLMVFKIKEPTKEVTEMAKDLLMTTEVVQKAIKNLKEKKYSHVQEYCIEINRLENRIDRVFRDALGKLFEDVDEIKDCVFIIKWKEIYEHLEDASDRCEDVANAIEGIVLKNA
jgi:predicted phosphate transport protein (TIGR00153 family)